MTFGFGAGVQRLGGVSVSTLAALNLISPASDVRPSGFVYADPTPANNGVYTWSGTAWARQRGLPDGVAAYGGVAGTANAITATAASGVDPAVCRVGVLTPAVANTGAVTLNGEAIKDRSGNPLSAGALAAGVATLLLRDGASWRLLTGNVAEISDVSGLQAALNGKVDPAAMAAAIAAAINGLVNGAGSALDTLNELSAALGNDPNFSTTILTTLGLPNQIANATDATLSDADHWVFRRFATGIAIKRTTTQVMSYFFSKLGLQIAGGTAKATPVDGDAMGFMDSAATNATKIITFAQMWLNYFKGKADALYIPKGATATISAGFTLTPAALGVITSRTIDPALGNYQFGTNNGAFTLTAPTADCAVDIMVTNGATAGSITFSGFTVSSNVGDPLTTTNGHIFLIMIRRINGVSTYIIKAYQ